jgi:hypothetical protein
MKAFARSRLSGRCAGMCGHHWRAKAERMVSLCCTYLRAFAWWTWIRYTAALGKHATSSQSHPKRERASHRTNRPYPLKGSAPFANSRAIMTCPDAIRRVAVPRPYRHVMGSQATSVSDRSVWRVCSMDSSRCAAAWACVWFFGVSSSFIVACCFQGRR